MGRRGSGNQQVYKHHKRLRYGERWKVALIEDELEDIMNEYDEVRDVLA